MSLTDRHAAVIIGSGSFLTGTLTLLREEPNLTNEGFDTLTQIWTQRIAGLTAEDVAALFPTGAKLGARRWWIVGAKPQQIAAGIWTIEVTYKGLAGDKPCKISWGSGADQQSGTDVAAPVTNIAGASGSATFARIATHEAANTFSFSYISEDTEEGWGGTPTIPTDKVGRERVLGTWLDPATGELITPPPVAESIWSDLPNYVYHFPNGWVLMGVDADILPGTKVGLISQAYKYVRPQTP